NGQLLVAWAGQAIPGSYQIQVHAPGGPPAIFVIEITAPLTITLQEGPVTSYDASEAQVGVAANAPQGTIIMASPVRTDASGNLIAGTTFAYSLGSAGLFVALADGSLATAWTTPPALGSYQIGISATSPDGSSEHGTLTVIIH